MQQALLLCMAHNLMLLLERTLEREEGIVDEKSSRKRAKRMRIIEEKLKEKRDLLNPLVPGLFRVTQRSLQFIRWLRNRTALSQPVARGCGRPAPPYDSLFVSNLHWLFVANANY